MQQPTAVRQCDESLSTAVVQMHQHDQSPGYRAALSKLLYAAFRKTDISFPYFVHPVSQLTKDDRISTQKHLRDKAVLVHWFCCFSLRCFDPHLLSVLCADFVHDPS